jgi:hypothetical protein
VEEVPQAGMIRASQEEAARREIRVFQQEAEMRPQKDLEEAALWMLMTGTSTQATLYSECR